MRSNNRSDSRGKLVVVEGIDGSGKSTQIRLLEKWLMSKGMRVFLIHPTSKGKKKGTLTPTTFCLLHAADFADKYERNIFLRIEVISKLTHFEHLSSNRS